MYFQYGQEANFCLLKLARNTLKKNKTPGDDVKIMILPDFLH